MSEKWAYRRVTSSIWKVMRYVQADHYWIDVATCEHEFHAADICAGMNAKEDQ